MVLENIFFGPGFVIVSCSKLFMMCAGPPGWMGTSQTKGHNFETFGHLQGVTGTTAWHEVRTEHPLSSAWDLHKRIISVESHMLFKPDGIVWMHEIRNDFNRKSRPPPSLEEKIWSNGRRITSVQRTVMIFELLQLTKCDLFQICLFLFGPTWSWTHPPVSGWSRERGACSWVRQLRATPQGKGCRYLKKQEKIPPIWSSCLVFPFPAITEERVMVWNQLISLLPLVVCDFVARSNNNVDWWMFAEPLVGMIESFVQALQLKCPKLSDHNMVHNFLGAMENPFRSNKVPLFCALPSIYYNTKYSPCFKNFIVLPRFLSSKKWWQAKWRLLTIDTSWMEVVRKKH